jgi:hypothetical protein
MAFYLVTTVQYNATGEVEYVLWRRDHSRSVVTVAEVVAAIDQGDTVEMWFSGPPQGQVSGGTLIKKILPSGKVTTAEATVIPGRTLFHLPRI